MSTSTSNSTSEQDTDWVDERKVVLDTFLKLLAGPTGDGSKKRQRGEKPPWWRDPTHEGAIFSHITKWKRGETRDPESGVHPLVHAAWRCLAIAYQETYGKVDPGGSGRTQADTPGDGATPSAT